MRTAHYSLYLLVVDKVTEETRSDLHSIKDSFGKFAIYFNLYSK